MIGMRLIDADAFRKWLCALFAGSGTHEDDTKEEEEWNASLARIITHLDEAPTVERPHGEWIFKNGKYRCTACGEKAIYRYNGMSNIPKEILTDFCYNCGSDNRKRGETE